MTGDWSKQRAVCDAGGLLPAGYRGRGPQGNRHAPNSTIFAYQIGDEPASLPFLYVSTVEARQFRTTQSGADEQGKRGRIAETLDCGQVRNGQESIRLFRREPMTQTHATLLGAFNACDSRRKFRGQQQVIGSFQSQPANGTEADIDAGGRQALGLQLRPVLLDGGFVERAARLVQELDQEFVERLGIGASGVARGDAIQHRCLQRSLRSSFLSLGLFVDFPSRYQVQCIPEPIRHTSGHSRRHT